jgi:putative aminopeptidase FrvX
MKNEEIIQLISELSSADGVSGHEGSVASIVYKSLSSLADTISIDPLGNVIAIKKGFPKEGKEPVKLMLAAHLDEIGLIVSSLDSKGFLKVMPIGGVDRGIILGKKVWVHTKTGRIPGVVATRPPHLTTEKERNQLPDWDDIFIDIGLEGDRCSKLVAIGDVCTLQNEVVQLSGQFIAGKALDNRVGVASLILMLNHLKQMNHEVDVYAVFTTQEEVGFRGAITSAYGIWPEVAVAVDVGFAQQSGVNERLGKESGKGPVIAKGPNIHPQLEKSLIKMAQRERIPHQTEVIAANSGTDAWAIQVSRCGIPTALLSIPLGNMHSTAECCHLDDIRFTSKLLAEFVLRLSCDEVRRWQNVIIKPSINSRCKR